MKPTKTTTPLTRNSINRSPLLRGFLLLPLALAIAWFALLPMARAVTPAPDGGYPNNNTAEGHFALQGLTSGSNNTAIGFNALNSNTTGSNITAIGSGALQNDSAADNTATGFEALFENTTGIQNTANGGQALSNNTSGLNNTATGFQALFSNTTGSFDTANGFGTLISNTTGSFNTATGSDALFANRTGNDNTATGVGALNNNSMGSHNTANGSGALSQNTIGNDNTAIGDAALLFNATGDNNTATGYQALMGNNINGHDNTANGVEALFNNSGSFNIALGSHAGSNLTTGDNNIDIGASGVAGESNTIRIGKAGVQKTAYMQGISGATVASGVTVIVGSNGHLGTVVSSERFKEAIKPMDKVSEAILALKPVTFRYKHELDPQGIPQFGLVAEQVEKVNPDLVVRDADGKVNTVRYEAVNAMLLNEFLKAHSKVQTLEATTEQLKKQVEVLTAGLQKVSDQLELTKSTPRIVADN
jgi:hypothetical protein